MTSPLDEFSYIEWIRSRVPPDLRLTVPIGDDAAEFRLNRTINHFYSRNISTLMTADMLLEGVHFTMPPATPEEVGRKALAVNLSDIAAMAGRPLAALVSVALPRNSIDRLPQRLHEGVQELAEEFGVAIAGGDTNSWNGPLVINVTLFGEPTGAGPVLRSGALPGDSIYVTGELGGSLVGGHLTFRPRVKEALYLQNLTSLHAMIDVSDGLSADLHHLLEESKVGAVILADSIPISDAARSLNDGVSPLDHALADGEDFELLFTVAASAGEKLPAELPGGVRLTRIGSITETPDTDFSGNDFPDTDSPVCVIEDSDGNRHPLPPRGWQHEL